MQHPTSDISLSPALSRTELKVFFCLLAASIVAKGAALFEFAYAVDTFHYIHGNMNAEVLLAAGRPGQALLHYLLNGLGASLDRAPVLAVSAAILLNAYAGVLLCRLWGLAERPLPAFLAASLMTLHPFTTEIFTFREVTAYNALALAVTAIAVIWVSAPKRPIFVPAIVFAIGLSIYQVAFCHIAIACMFAVAVRLVNADGSSQGAKWLVPADWSRFMLLVVGCGIYVMMLVFYWKVLGIRVEGRTETITLGEAPARFMEISKLLWGHLAGDGPLVTKATKYLLLVVGGLAALAMLFRPRAVSVAGDPPSKQLPTALVLPACLLLTVVAAYVVFAGVATNKAFWPMPRTLTGMGVLWAGVATIALVASSTMIRKTTIVLSCILLLSFAGLSNQVFLDQGRVNLRDMLQATRLLVQIESQPGFDKARKLAIVGGGWGYESSIPMAVGDLNMSVLYPPWGKLGLFREVSGYLFEYPSEEQWKQAQAHCASVKPWPSPENSAKIIDNLIVLCLRKQ